MYSINLMILQIIRLEERIFTTVEFKGRDMVLSAKINVERRCGLYPFPLQIELHKTVVDKEVTPHELNKLLCSKMIPNISKTNSGRNATGSSQRAEEGGLGHAEASAPFEHITCAIMFRKIKRRIRVIKDRVTYCQIQLHGDLDRLLTSPHDDFCIISNAGMIAINNRC
jgi:hypothetical protein